MAFSIVSALVLIMEEKTRRIMMIAVEHVTKCYGDFMAVNDLSFEIDEGHVYGF